MSSNGTSSWTARTISTMLGGRIWASVPDAATTPAASFGSYPLFSIVGSATSAIAITAAETKPVMAAMHAPTSTAA